MPSWLRISPDSVKTPLEIASEFVKNEYALTYVRHPIADFHLEKHQLNDLLTLVNTNKVSFRPFLDYNRSFDVELKVQFRVNLTRTLRLCLFRALELCAVLLG